MPTPDDFLDELIAEGTARDPQFPARVGDALRRREASRDDAPITHSVDELIAEQGGTPLTPEEFEEHFGGLPSDGEG